MELTLIRPAGRTAKNCRSLGIHAFRISQLIPYSFHKQERNPSPYIYRHSANYVDATFMKKMCLANGLLALVAIPH